VLTVGTWNKSTRLAKKLPKIGTLIEVKAPKQSELPDRLAQYAHDAHDKRLSSGAAALLVEINGDELAQLYGEVDKLALYADKEKTINESHVEALIGHNRVFGAFEVIDAVTDNNVGHAVTRLRNMFAEDKSAEYTVVGAFAYHLRQLFGARVCLDKGMRPFDIYKQVGIWHRKEQLLAQARRMKLEQIASCLEQLGQVDYAIKTGRTTARVAMEQMVLRLAGG
jgi:DNA polymerase-3 subunit delta